MAVGPPLAGQILGHYRVLEQIGAGGMGVVYRARDERLERDVALKVLLPGTLTDACARARFRREALALSRLNHPHIATVHDFDSHEGTDFLVTELVSGSTLDERLSAAPLPEEDVVRIGLQLADGLEAAHREGIIHRDLKPGNLRLTPQGRLKILDFGLAKRIDAADEASTTLSLGEPGEVAGTVAYMAPEQLKAEKPDHRADLWAAGVVLYELATGRRPFEGRTVTALSDQILHAAVPSPRAFDLSPGLAGVILRCLEKDAGDRYQSAKELRVDLERLNTQTARTAKVTARAVRTVAVLALSAALLIALATSVYVGREARASSPRITSLAVLPLVNMSGDSRQEYFADGMTEALITDLAKISALKVISRTSVMQYKGAKRPLPEIARELGVSGIVEGSVFRSGDRVRITAQLINAANDTHVWADEFDRDARDVLALQSEVARAIAQQIRVSIAPAEREQLASSRRVNPEAHELYLKGRYYWWQRRAPEMAKAIQSFEQAIRLDPGYAPAYAGLADAYAISADNGFQTPEAGKARAREAAVKAVALDDSLADAHVALGSVYDNYDWDWPRAEEEYRRAIHLNPNSALAYLAFAEHLSAMGSNDEAIAAARRAREMDPLAIRIRAVLGAVFYCARRYDEAIAASNNALELDPHDEMAIYTLGKTYLQKGQYPQAVAELERLQGTDSVTALVGAYAAAGQPARARGLLDQLVAESRRRYVSPCSLAEAHAGVANDAEILTWLEKAYKERDPALPWNSRDPMWDRLRSDPRFVNLLRRMNLQP